MQNQTMETRQNYTDTDSFIIHVKFENVTEGSAAPGSNHSANVYVSGNWA